MSPNPSSSLRVLIVGVVVAAMVYGAALTLALTEHLGSATDILVLIVGAVPRCPVSASVSAAPYTTPAATMPTINTRRLLLMPQKCL